MKFSGDSFRPRKMKQELTGKMTLSFLFVNHLSLRRTLLDPLAHTPAILFAIITALPTSSPERGAIGSVSRGELAVHGSC